MKRSRLLGIYAALWILVLAYLFAVPAWIPGDSTRGAAIAWFILQKGPAVLLLYLMTDFLALYRKKETFTPDIIPEYFKKRRTAVLLFVLGIALFVVLNLL
jgi:hypothetical protein